MFSVLPVLLAMIAMLILPAAVSAAEEEKIVQVGRAVVTYVRGSAMISAAAFVFLGCHWDDKEVTLSNRGGGPGELLRIKERDVVGVSYSEDYRVVRTVQVMLVKIDPTCRSATFKIIDAPKM